MTGQELIHGQNHSHLPLLIAAVLHSTGPVLELGMGDASTPNLHALLCGAGGRQLISLDDAQDWVDRMSPLRQPWHRIERCDWSSLPIDGMRFGAVLVDNAPAGIRAHHILLLKDRADFIIVHDSDSAGYGMENVWGSFQFKGNDFRYRPGTSWLSNVRPLNVDW